MVKELLRGIKALPPPQVYALSLQEAFHPSLHLDLRRSCEIRVWLQHSISLLLHGVAALQYRQNTCRFAASDDHHRDNLNLSRTAHVSFESSAHQEHVDPWR